MTVKPYRVCSFQSHSVSLANAVEAWRAAVRWDNEARLSLNAGKVADSEYFRSLARLCHAQGESYRLQAAQGC